VTSDFATWNETMVKRYDLERFHDHPSPLVRAIERARIDRIFELLAVDPESRVLEVGCGAGHLLARARGRRAVGIDLSAHALGQARRRVDGRADLLRGDAQCLPFRPGAFDRVYCSEVLEHLPAPEAALAEIERLLAPGGIAVLSVPNEPLINRLKALLRGAGLFRLLLGARDGAYVTPDRMDDEWHLHAYTLDALRGQVPPTWRVAAVAGVPFRWLPLRYVIRCEPVSVPGHADAVAATAAVAAAGHRPGAPTCRAPRPSVTVRLAAAVLGSPRLFDVQQRVLAADLRPVRHRVASLLSSAQRASVLDACCGTGSFSRVATGAYLGIDVDPRAIARARRKFRHEPRKRFCVADVGAVDLPPRAFETVIFANGLHHLEAGQAVAALRSLARAARSLVVVVDPAVETRRTPSRLLLALERGRHLRPAAEQRSLLRAAGLTIVREEDVDAGWAAQRIFLCAPAAGEPGEARG
jgi:SAM-dependent methyltransferase